MARIRTIKPEFPQSETVGALSRDARLLFIQLWTVADDAGRLRGASRMLASLLYPYDDDAVKLIGKWLDELERKNCIRRYEVDGSQYIEIVNWLKHQKIDRPSKSRLPPYSEGSTKPREPSRALDADLVPSTSTSTSTKDGGADAHREARTENRTDKRDLDSDFEAWYREYPRREGRGQALKAYRTARKKLDADGLLAAARRARERYRGTEPKYIPLPATFLNGERWLDEPAQPAESGPDLSDIYPPEIYRGLQ